LDLRCATPIKNLYFTGVDISGCGISGGMYGGLLTACSIDRRILRIMKEA